MLKNYLGEKKMKVYVAQDRNELNDSTILFTSKKNNTNTML